MQPSTNIAQSSENSTHDGQKSDAKNFISDLYTGSVADYAKADLKYVATGTGAQSYGWGLYSTDTRSRGEGYANVDAKMKNVRKVVYKGNEYTQRSNFLGELDGLTVSCALRSMLSLMASEACSFVRPSREGTW